jgi:uncharacterized protein
MFDSVMQDQRLPVTWDSRPGDFISLMTLYESNHLQLRQLVPRLASMQGANMSSVQGESPLLLTLLERGPYTTTFSLTYLFESAGSAVRDPDLTVRIYHDAAMAEALACARWHHHDVLSAIRGDLHVQLGDRWLRNMMLNKWLDYCLMRGHQHAWQACA